LAAGLFSAIVPVDGADFDPLALGVVFASCPVVVRVVVVRAGAASFPPLADAAAGLGVGWAVGVDAGSPCAGEIAHTASGAANPHAITSIAVSLREFKR
jgi:hypothetical protein